MDSDLKTKFDDFGCACRCLIAIANDLGNPITLEYFIDELTPQIPYWRERCGVTDLGLILDLARFLKIGNSFQTFISKKEVKKRIKENKVKAILLFTEKKQEDDGSLSDYFHCSLILPSLTAEDGFVHQSVGTNMERGIPQPIDDALIDHLAGYFLLIY